jgi:hypothetical protein
VRSLDVWRQTQDTKKLLRTIYNLENQTIGAFLNTGSLDTVLSACGTPCIVTVFPFASEADLMRVYGVNASRLEALIAEKHVIPLIQFPTRYQTLPFLHLILNFKPMNYFPRSVYFYYIFFDDTTDLVTNGRLVLSPTLNDLYERAKSKSILARVLTSNYSVLRELYQQHPAIPLSADQETSAKENIYYRYASVASFIGEDVTDFILETYATERALSILLDLHLCSITLGHKDFFRACTTR